MACGFGVGFVEGLGVGRGVETLRMGGGGSPAGGGRGGGSGD